MDSTVLRNLLDEPFVTLSDDLNKLQKLVMFYRNIYDKDICTGCGGNDKYYQYYLKLKNEGLTIMENKETATFLLNKGVTGLPMEFGSSRYLTPANITDELALEYLAINKNRIIHFEKYPEDWQDQVAKFKGETTEVKKGAAKNKQSNPAEQTATAKTEKRAVTQEDLDKNPDLVTLGIQLGEEYEFPVEATAPQTTEVKKGAAKNK